MINKVNLTLMFSFSNAKSGKEKPNTLILVVYVQIDLAPYVGASLDVMRRDSDVMRDGGATVFTAVKHGEGVDAVIDLILSSWEASGAKAKA